MSRPARLGATALEVQKQMAPSQMNQASYRACRHSPIKRQCLTIQSNISPTQVATLKLERNAMGVWNTPCIVSPQALITLCLVSPRPWNTPCIVVPQPWTLQLQRYITYPCEKFCCHVCIQILTCSPFICISQWDSQPTRMVGVLCNRI